ncbi:hypothetical protein C8C93_3755 [Acidovorax sp. 93]|jgi:hypothetical protein|uniref:Uncharacterized protein n=1 Tax=Acidovorax facilis TaxID=12917 RepID=A0ABV8DAA4_9BURK|nr:MULTISPECIES: hypothetical protein [Acidovorax]KQB57472.1 hypothetical protein AE621_20740 [Acidovorax sp. SD340]MBO1008608.1 hypothetical protein [Acidovorax sp. SD340]MCO4242586.1 hypothetical protein [Acidovorax facilis]RKR28472.1 hypothetical protein C8C93_3755 [Acidovorax sp. 93]
MATSRSDRSSNSKKKTSTWRSVRMPHHGTVARTLQQRYSLRWHGLLIGSFTLLLMWCTSHVQMLLGVESLALRYFVTLSVGYLGYLLVLRAWAARLVRSDRDKGGDGSSLDVPDVSWPSGSSGGGSGQVPLPRTGGGDFGGGGASGDFGGAWTQGLSSGGSGSDSSALGDLASGAADAIGSADEGAVVVVPVVAIFLIGAAIIFGAGSLAMLFFGWDVLLTVAVEIAFSVATARAAVGVEREGWLTAAVRLTWKPLLGALVCAVVLGATIDHFMPGVQSLPQAVRVIQGQ